jgi:RNA recognition motif-containing protein
MREKVEREGVGVVGGPRAYGGKKSDYIHNIDQISTSFYFTNFPEDKKSRDLWEVFAKYGHVVDVYIPFKVDKRGKRFGFVKFKDVLDVEDLSRSLEDVWCGSFKLRINQSRFGRNEGSKGVVKTGLLKTGVGDSKSVHHELSFKDALVPWSQGSGLVGEDREIVAIKVSVDASQLQLLNKCFVGFLRPEV